MTFSEVVLACANNREFVNGIDGLRGTDFGQLNHRDGLARMIDDATGRDHDRAREFCEIVFDLVWMRVRLEEIR